MSRIKHIHEVIFLIEKHNGRLDGHELEEAIAFEWGAEIMFSACSGNLFPKENALEFLISRNKVVFNEMGQIALHPSLQICEGHKDFAG